MRTLILAVSAIALLTGPALAANTPPMAKAVQSGGAAPGGKPMAAAPTTAKPAKPAKPARGETKMGRCAGQWKAMGEKGQVTYNDRAKSMKSKKGGKLSGYNAFTAECMKKA